MREWLHYLMGLAGKSPACHVTHLETPTFFLSVSKDLTRRAVPLVESRGTALQPSRLPLAQ